LAKYRAVRRMAIPNGVDRTVLRVNRRLLAVITVAVLVLSAAATVELTGSSLRDLVGQATDGPPAPEAGWTRILTTTFDEPGVLPDPWRKYDFANGNRSWGWYLASHVVIEDGIARVINSYQSSGPAPSTRTGYGTNGAGFYQGAFNIGSAFRSNAYRYTEMNMRIMFRMRIVNSGGQYAHRNIPLRWPTADDGTTLNPRNNGEENFFESDGAHTANDGYFRSFWHNGADTGQDLQKISHWGAIDASQWHVYKMQRVGFELRGWVDDVLKMSYTGSATTLPVNRKRIVFQQEFPHGNPNGGTQGFEEWQIDWIVLDVPS
jgi:hypothetical protein